MNIDVYSKTACSKCDQAKILLKMKSLNFTIKLLDVDYTLEELQSMAPQAREFPAIFIDSKYLGTLKELKEYINEITE